VEVNFPRHPASAGTTLQETSRFPEATPKTIATLTEQR
jgi:hypothetical protein